MGRARIRYRRKDVSRENCKFGFPPAQHFLCINVAIATVLDKWHGLKDIPVPSAWRTNVSVSAT